MLKFLLTILNVFDLGVGVSLLYYGLYYGAAEGDLPQLVWVGCTVLGALFMLISFLSFAGSCIFAGKTVRYSMNVSIALAIPVSLFALSLALALTVPSARVQNLLKPYEGSIPEVPDSQIGPIHLKSYSSLDLFQYGCFALALMEVFRFVLSRQLNKMHSAFEDRVEGRREVRRAKQDTAREKRVAKHMGGVRKRIETDRTSSLETVLAQARARKAEAERGAEEDVDLEQDDSADEPLLEDDGAHGVSAWERTGEERDAGKSSWFMWSSSSKEKKVQNRGSIN
jgi:hypothetical protein